MDPDGVPLSTAASLQEYPTIVSDGAGGAIVTWRDLRSVISIYDVAGRMARELVNEHRNAGTWSVQWNGDNSNGQRVASGVYFYRMRAGSFVETKKMVLLK